MKRIVLMQHVFEQPNLSSPSNRFAIKPVEIKITRNPRKQKSFKSTKNEHFNQSGFRFFYESNCGIVFMLSSNRQTAHLVSP